MRYLYNDRSLRDRRRELRRNMTHAEILLWERIRMRRMKGFKFLRQYSVGPYILDFYCVRLKLGIEVDGRFHAMKNHVEYDLIRLDFLAEHGIEIIRFWNDRILGDTDSVLHEIEEKIGSISISPLEEGEKPPKAERGYEQRRMEGFL